MPIGGLMAIRFNFNAIGVDMSTGFHLYTTDSVDPAHLDAVVAQLATAGAGTIRNTFAAILTTGDTWTSISASQVADPSTPNELVAKSETVLGIGGTRSMGSNTAPGELTATITLQTGITSRRARGRMFMPPPRDNAVLANELFSSGHAYYTAIVAFTTALENLLASSGTHLTGALANADLVVYSKPQFLADALPGFPVTNVRPNLKSHWLRSRAR